MDSTSSIGTLGPTTKLMTPLYYMDPYLSTIKIGFPLIGIPINLLVAGTILFNRRLRATQNIAWLGCGFANVFLLFSFLVEFAAAQDEDSFFFLSLYQIMVGLPDAYQILYLFLSWLDRHLFFNHTSFYKKYVTNLVILAIQFACFVLVTVLLKGRFLYRSLITHSFKLSNLTEKDIAIAITSVFMGICLLYVPFQQLLENRSNRKEQKQFIPKNNNANSIESKTTKAQSELSDDRVNIEGTNIIENMPENSSSSLETISLHKQVEKPDNLIPDGNNYPDKATSNNPENNQQQNFSQSELRSYYSIKTNIQAKFVLIILPLIFLAISMFCLLFCIIDGSFFETCYTWLATTVYLYGVCMGFYTAIFNPICFASYNHDFVELKQRYNPIVGIARMISRFYNRFENPNFPPNTHHYDAVATMV